MFNSVRVVRLTRTRSIRCYECGEKRGVWWFTTLLLPSKRRRGKSMWMMRGFEFHLSLSLSLSLSLLSLISLSLSLIPGVLVCGCHLPYFALATLSRNLSFIAFLTSDRIKLGFLCFLPWGSQIGRKITFNYFYFLTNFINISLCADPMRRSPFFHFKESLSTDNIRWMLSGTLVRIIILCVR